MNVIFFVTLKISATAHHSLWAECGLDTLSLQWVAISTPPFNSPVIGAHILNAYGPINGYLCHDSLWSSTFVLLFILSRYVQ